MKVLVIGATGNQGGHVARLLLQKGHGVTAFTRQAQSHAAQNLANLGARIVTGDLNDRTSVERAAEGVDAIFAMGTPFEAANRNTGIPHFESKWVVEQHIARIGVEAAIVAPVYFMENLLAFQKQRLQEGYYATPLRADLKLSQIALNDLAGFAVLALENKQRFVGKRIDVASDDLTGAQAAAILAKVLGKPINYFQVPLEEIRKMSEDLMKMYEWFDRVGYHLDIAGLHGEYPEVGWHTYEAWVREQDWEAILSE
jgi:uncharacterized protein YbjT (DUF2867 family)